MTTDGEKWKAVASRLGVDIIAPFDVELSGNHVQFTALLPHFGAPGGMVVDADWDAIQKHMSSLLAAGFAFSCVEPPDPAGDIEEMLADWGWTGPLPKPHWL